MSKDAAIDPSPSPTRRLARWVGREPLQAVTILGLFVYGALRFAFFLFYAPFRVSPEQVGHGYAATLAQALVGTILILLFVLSLLTTIVVFLIAVIAPTIILFQRFGHKAPAWFAGTAAVAFLADALFVLPGWAGGGNPLGGGAGATIFGWWVLGLLFDDFENPKTLALVLPALKKLTVPVSLVAVGVVLFLLIPAAAHMDRAAVADGHARSSQFAGILGFPWGADLVITTWLGESDPGSLDFDACFMYLGRADGIVVLWDPDAETVHRLPSDRIAMTSPRASSCEDLER